MHIVFRESRGLDDAAAPYDPGQTPAEMVALSFSDSDLGAFAAGWHRARDLGAALPSLRLCNLVGLRHPVSVDEYAERTLSGARAILVRVIGGEGYWPYGLAVLQDLARRRGIALAVLSADGRVDARLDQLSTLPEADLRRLQALCETGGAEAARMALGHLARAAGLDARVEQGSGAIPAMGLWDPQRGVLDRLAPSGTDARGTAGYLGTEEAASGATDRPLVLVTFYRSWLTAADTEPVAALIGALRRAGFRAVGAFAASLKAPGFAGWLRGALGAVTPVAVVNTTAFSARGDDGRAPFDGWDAPVFQVALSTARRRDWVESERGLSPADLAMNIVLPEVDGRVFAGVVSFKQPGARDPDLEFSRFAHRAEAERIDAAVARVAAWHRLAVTPARGRRLALILSTYPGRPHQIAHAVGLDALASSAAVLDDLAEQGWDVAPCGDLAGALLTADEAWPLDAYRAALSRLPQGLRDDLAAAWGAPEDDPAVRDGAFHFAAVRRGNALVALQPERGARASREDEYHDLTRVPCHGYVAFYLWLARHDPHAMIHMGAHGTLEWLPGKSVALSAACWPDVLTGALPVVYPFIVNDPGEAAQARRRLGAVTLGHLPPPLAASAVPEALQRLERMLDEYATAEGLDSARRDRLIAAIREEAHAAGIEADLGIPPGASAAEAIPRIDRFVCDLKESRFGDGLHVWGRGACGVEERAGLAAALSGRRVAAGPSGSPNRGRTDVLPTGRNLYSVDPRAVPTRAAHAQGVKQAEELVRRHLQDHGDWPRGLVVDLWGSATMRTAGEDYAMALHLAGLAPVWDAASGRVTGVEAIPPVLLRRPRIDVTLRVSGLFRDIFPGLAQLFETGAAMLAERDEPEAENPYRARIARVFGPQPGLYGLGMGTIDDFSPEARSQAAEAWLSSSSWAIGADGESRPDRAGIEARLRGADGFVHAQDLPESDLLLAQDYAAHEAGFAAAARSLGAAPALYHLDITRAGDPRARTLTEEIARTVRARAANPDWVAGMMRHGFRGAAELTATAEHMAAFAHLAQAVPPHLFDLYHDATLGRDDVVAFMENANPQALAALRDLFRRLRDAGLWATRRNSIAASLEDGR